MTSSPLPRLAAFALLLALVFGGGLAAGAAVGPFEDGQPAAEHDSGPMTHGGHP